MNDDNVFNSDKEMDLTDIHQLLRICWYAGTRLRLDGRGNDLSLSDEIRRFAGAIDSKAFERSLKKIRQLQKEMSND